MSTNQKFRAFFKTKEATKDGVELLRKFIIPFSRGMKSLGVDDVIASFFALDNRGFFYARANRDFNMPGKFFVAGNRPVLGLGPRKIRKGKLMLIVVDRVDSTAKIAVEVKGEELNYLLEKFEFETIKDWLNVVD